MNNNVDNNINNADEDADDADDADADDAADDDFLMAQLQAQMEAMVAEGGEQQEAEAEDAFFANMVDDMMDQEEEEENDDDDDDDDEQAMMDLDAVIAAEVAQAEAAAAATEAAEAEAASQAAVAAAAAAAAEASQLLLQDPDPSQRRPWDDIVDAGPPAEHPPPFHRPHYSRGRRVTVVAYIPQGRGTTTTTTGGGGGGAAQQHGSSGGGNGGEDNHTQLHNCLMRDFEREPVVVSSSSSSSSTTTLLAYYPIPHKRPIETIMGHVEICAVLERDVCDDDDISRKSDTDDEETDEGIVFRLTNRFVAVKVNYCTRIEQMRNRHAEDPMKEIAAMQLIGDDIPGVMGCSEVLYVSGRDVLDQAAIQQPASVANKSFFKRKNPPSHREQDNDTINVVMRYCQHGDLFEALQQPWRSVGSSSAAASSSTAAALDAAADHRPGFSEPQARFWFRQIMQGIRDLHDMGVCHRDLSPENVMIDDNGCLIIDLGMCLRVPYTTTIDPGKARGGNGDKDLQEPDKSSTTTTTTTTTEPRTVVALEPPISTSSSSNNVNNGPQQQHAQPSQEQQQPPLMLRKLLFMPQGACGKLPYMSPEIYANRQAFDGAAVDVWSAGTILFCMLTGNRSYHRPHASDAQFYWMTTRGGLHQLLQDWNINLSKEGLHLLRNMLQVDPRLRLTIDEVLNHVWFQLPHGAINVVQHGIS